MPSPPKKPAGPRTGSDTKKFNSIRKGTGGRAVHDVGGLDFGPIDRDEHDLALWEKRVDAMAILLVSPRKAAYKLDSKRRVIENYVEQQYDQTEYYEKWIRAIRDLLVEQEIATRPEIDAKVADVARRMKAAGRAVRPGGVPWSGKTVSAAKPVAKPGGAAKSAAARGKAKP
jgi:hypothetical protein